MADYQAVGLDVKPPDPSQAFNSINSILGIQQKRQQLQSQALTIQSQQAGLVGQQQQARETAAGAQLLADPIGNGLTDSDGNVAPGAQAKILRVMPITGTAKYDDLVKAATGNVQYKNAWLKLRSDTRQDVSARLQGAAVDPNTGMPEIHDTLDAIKSDYAGTPAAKEVDTIVGVSKGAIDDAANKHGLPGAKGVIQHFSRGGLANTELSGTGGLGTPQATSNAAGQKLNRNPVTGELSQPPGAATLNPTTSQVAGRTTGSVGTASADRSRADEVGGMQQDASAAIPITKRIDQLATEINSGHLAKMISETGNYLGFSSVNDARSQLNKDLGRVRGLASSRAGSDSRAATLLEGYPTDTSPENTIHGAMDYLRGTARQTLARGQLLSQYQKSDPDGLRGFQAADNVMNRNTHPLMHEYLALKPDEQKAFYRHNFSTAKEAQAFKDEVTAVKKHSRVFDQQ